MTIQDDIKLIVEFRFKRHKISAYQGEKKSRICPRCGGRGFAFIGRWKQCPTCGYSNYWQKMVKHIKFHFKNGRMGEIRDALVVETAKYIRRLKDVKK